MVTHLDEHARALGDVRGDRQIERERRALHLDAHLVITQ